MDPTDYQEDLGKMEMKKTEITKKTSQIGLTNFMDSCIRLTLSILTSCQPLIPFPFLFPISVRGSPGTLIPDTLAVKPKVSQSTDSMICGP
jgi:hypothetical protein